MIKSAQQYPVHQLLSHESNLEYRVPPYQREYSWQKAEWEDLFQDLVEADGAHFLGTIITLNKTVDSAASNILEVIDGQQRLTTLTLLLAAIYSALKQQDLDDEVTVDVVNLGRSLVRKSDGKPRVTPQRQGHNLDDYLAVLRDTGLKIDAVKQPYFPLRRVFKCFAYFKNAIQNLAETDHAGDVVAAALRVLQAVQQAIIVKIEVASHADAFVLFESLNNRGVPLTPVDLIKNHLLAESERKKVLEIDEAFKRWSTMLSNLGDSYATHERFLRHYYNAFKNELPDVPNAPVATRARLIRIYETLLADGLLPVLDDLVATSELYGRITCVNEPENGNALDAALRRLMRAQGSPSYVLVMWLMKKKPALALADNDLVAVVDLLTSFFVRRNLTGFPQTYALPKLFMTTIDRLATDQSTVPVETLRESLTSQSSSEEEFRTRLVGPIYEESSDLARFILTTLSEDAMTKETWTDLWLQEKGHFVWTIEHVFPQGENIPPSWQAMMGGPEAAAEALQKHVHRLGNLTITAYNSNLGNKSFAEKRDRTDAQGRHIGYRNGLALNTELKDRESWTVEDIEERTKKLVDEVIARFPL